MKPQSWQTYLRFFAPFAFCTSLFLLLFASAVSLFLESELFSLQYARELESLQKDAVACSRAYQQRIAEKGEQEALTQPELLLPAYLQQAPEVGAVFLITRAGRVLTENRYFDVGRELLDAQELTVFFADDQDCYALTPGSEPLLSCAANVQGTPLVLVSLQPAAELNSGYQKLQGIVVSGALIVFALSFLSSLLFAARPVKSILAAKEQLSVSQWEKRTQNAQQFLTNLCLYGRSQVEIERVLPELETPLNLEEPLGLFLVQVDGLAEFQQQPEREQAALLYGIKNLLEERLSCAYTTVGLPDADRRWGLFLYQTAGPQPPALLPLLTRARNEAEELLGLSLSLTYSRQMGRASGLCGQYERLAQASRMRLFLGWSCCIDADDQPQPASAPLLVQTLLYRDVDDLNRKLKLGEIQNAAPYCKLLHPYRGRWVEYQSVLLAVKNGLEQCMLLVQSSNCITQNAAMSQLGFEGCETEAQVEKRLHDYVAQLIAQIQGAERHRLTAYVEQANLLIEANFNNSGYGVQQLADDMRLSNAYISKVYKEQTGSGLMEQLIARRMRQAAYLVRETEVPIGDIWQHAGYASVNYFYRVFRKTYGATPVEYRRMARQQTSPKEETGQ